MSDEDDLDVRRAKLAELGALVPGVAHDIKTPLGSIKSSADIARRAVEKIVAKLPDSDPKMARLVEMLNESTTTISVAQERIREILQSLHAFTHEDQEKKATDLHVGIDSTLIVIGHLLRGRAEVVKAYGQLPPVNCRASEINQVVMNLLTNAARSIDGEGTITITTSHRGDEVTVEVRDTGCGMDAEILERIFEPGFTTKASTVGSGLGLAVAKRVAESHGGRVEVESAVGEGSTFRLVLPVG